MMNFWVMPGLLGWRALVYMWLEVERARVRGAEPWACDLLEQAIYPWAPRTAGPVAEA